MFGSRNLTSSSFIIAASLSPRSIVVCGVCTYIYIHIFHIETNIKRKRRCYSLHTIVAVVCLYSIRTQERERVSVFSGSVSNRIKREGQSDTRWTLKVSKEEFHITITDTRVCFECFRCV